MVDNELVEGLRALLPECTRDESEALLAAVKERFQIDGTATWWWSAVGVDTETIAYEGNDPTPHLGARLGDEATKAFLIATDDAPPPWPVFRGGWLELVGAMLEQRFFEYARCRGRVVDRLRRAPQSARDCGSREQPEDISASISSR